MNLVEKILIFRTCLALLVVAKRLVNDQLTDGGLKKKTIDSLTPLIQQVNDRVNFLYAEESKTKVRQK